MKLSILFLAWNGLDATKESLESIFKYTTVPFEIIMIDNGSTDGVQILFDTMVEEVKNNKDSYVFCEKATVIHNEKNLGVSKGYNVGFPLMSDESEYITVSSNDWIYSPNWAEKMIACLESEPMCGLATACSNMSATSMIDSHFNKFPKMKEKINWDDKELFEKVEKINEHVEQNKDNYTINQFVCIGWTMKKQVYKDVGLMDEKILSANDVAYTYKAVSKGWISKTNWNTYLHHFWSVSGSQIDQKELIRRDQVDWKRILSHPEYKK